MTQIVEGSVTFPLEQHLAQFAKNFAPGLQTPLVIWLQGDLGTGKTAFARALIHALGYQGRVKSPTYGLLEQYRVGTLQVLHMDLYRISDPAELEYLGVIDMLDEQTVLLVEWPEKAARWLPDPDFVLAFSYAGDGREMHWSALTPVAQHVISKFPAT